MKPPAPAFRAKCDRVRLRAVAGGCLLALAGCSLAAAPVVDDTALLQRVADSILRQTSRQLIDRSTGQTFTESADLPLG